MRYYKFILTTILMCLFAGVISAQTTYYKICFGEEGQEYCVDYPAGTTATISVPAASRECYHFEQWMDGNTDNPRTILVTTDATYTATYAPNDIIVQTQSADASMGTTSGDGTFKCGTDVTIKASAVEHYHFTYWEKNGVRVSGDSVYTFEVKGNHNEVVTYIAHFAVDSVYVNVTANDDTKGTVSQSHSTLNAAENNPFIYPWWTTGVILSATVTDPCYRFQSWSDGSTQNPYQLPSLEQDTLNIVANFVPKKDTLTIKYLNNSVEDVSVTSGSVISVGSNQAQVEVDCGEDANITVTSNNPCYIFSGWDFNNDNSIDQELDSNQVTISHTETALTSNRVITLKMRKKKFHVQIKFDPEQGTPWWAPGRPGQTNNAWMECDIIQLYGAPNACYNFDHWQYGENPADVGTEWNGIYIHSDSTFYAFYREKSWNITFGPNDAQMGEVRAEYLGSAASSPLPTMHCDSTFTLTPIANDGYLFKGWSDGSQDSVRTILVDNDTPSNFTAIFVPQITLTLRAQTDDGSLGGGVIENVTAASGSIIPESIVNPWSWYCTDGSQVSFTASTSEPCYEFQRWTDGDTNPTRTVSVTSDTTFAAVFAEKQYIITIHMVDNDDNQEFSTITEVVKCLTPDITLSKYGGECYEFIRWDDGSYPEERPISSVNCDMQYTAYYTHKKSTVTVQSASSYGTAVIQETTSTMAERYCGETLTLVASGTRTCYEFKQWDDGNTDSIRTITVGAENKTYIASFGIKEFTLSASATPAGVATISGTGVYECGEVITTLKAEPVVGCYMFLGWSDGETSLQHSPITMTEDVNLTAQFSDEYTITFGPNNTAYGRVDGIYQEQTYTSSITTKCDSTFTLIPVAADHHIFVGWSDGVTDSVRTITFTDSSPTSYTAIFSPEKERLTLNAVIVKNGADTGAGGGMFSLTPLPSGYTNPVAPATFIYGYSDQVQVAPIPNEGYRFVGWKDSSDSIRNLTITEDVALTAMFEKIVYTVTLETNPSGAAIGITDKPEYEGGETATLTFTTDPCYEFISWEDGTTSPSKTFVVHSDTVVRANFSQKQYSLTVNTNDPTLGTVTGGGMYACGDMATVTATPIQPGYRFERWIETGSRQNPYDVTVGSNMTLTAEFVEDVYTLYVEVLPAHSATVTGAGTYPNGTDVVVNITPDDCFELSGWSDAETDASSRTIHLTSDSVVTAILDWQYFTATIVLDPADAGEPVTKQMQCGNPYFINPPEVTGWNFVSWSDGTTGAKYISSVEADTTFTAVLERKSYNVNVDCDPTRGSVSGGGTYLYEEIAHLVAVPDSGYQFVGWSDGYDRAEYDLLVKSDTAVTAYFRTMPFTIYVIKDDTVCAGAEYTLPSGTVVPHPAGATLYVDSTDFEYEPGVWCKRIFTITLYPADDTPQPRITLLPKANAGQQLALAEATESSLADIESRATALSPAVLGCYWEILNESTGDYDQYLNTYIPAVDSLTLRFVVTTSCQVLPSEPVTVPVGQKHEDPYGVCVNVVYLNVDADTTRLEIDTKRMFHLGYIFSESDVEWYKVVDAKDEAEAEVLDDEFVAAGYTLYMSKLGLHPAEYYARISLPEQTQLVPCSDVLLSKAVAYSPVQFDDFILVPNHAKSGEVMTLLGLKDTDVAAIRVYDSAGRTLLDTEVKNVTSFDYQTTGNSGVYMMRVQTEDRKKTLKFVIE